MMQTAQADRDQAAPTTRMRILVLLRRQGSLTAPELSRHLGLTPVGVRRHLALLQRDGIVTASASKPLRGRPAAVYRLTEAGVETFPRHYDELAREALTFLKGRDARTLGAFLDWRNERLAAEYTARVAGGTVEQRAEALAEVLNDQGFMAEVERAPDGLRLCQHNCTVEHLATELPDLCASEAALFGRVLGAKVQREATIVDGAVRCVTFIPRQQVRAASAPVRPRTTKAVRSPSDGD